MSGWFSLGRKDGRPSWYENNFALSNTVDFETIPSTLAITLPFIAFLPYIISQCGQKRTLLLFQLTLLAASAGVLGLPLVVSPWSKAHKIILTQIGRDSQPIKIKIGIQSGLRKILIYMDTPHVLQGNHFLSKELTLGHKQFLHQQHMSALKNEWPWPLLFITALLGGEAYSWNALLGQCVYTASRYAEPFFIVSIYLWIIWWLSYMVVPLQSHYSMAMFGLALIGSVVSYSYVLYTFCPGSILPDGQILYMELAWGIILMGGVGTGLCVLSLGIIVNELKFKWISGRIVNDKRSYGERGLNKIENSTRIRECEKVNEMENLSQDTTDKPLSPMMRSQMFV